MLLQAALHLLKQRRVSIRNENNRGETSEAIVTGKSLDLVDVIKSIERNSFSTGQDVSKRRILQIAFVYMHNIDMQYIALGHVTAACSCNE